MSGDPLPDDWPLACPACRTPLGSFSSFSDEARCPGCGLAYPCVEGIWRFLPPERSARFAPFLADYTRIRQAEQRGSEDPAYYLGLPDCPPDHPIAWQWALRRRTYAALTRRVLPRLGQSLKVVDLGAGVGWLSNRLALLGHHPLAVDLTTDDRDGLGAARHYLPSSADPPANRLAPRWPRVQAEFDRLPLADETADLVIFNASLHYSTDYAVTLGEALRVLVRGGSMVVLETPLYKSDESGSRMTAERHADFARRFGTRSDALPSREYLTWEGVAELGRRLGVRFRAVTPWYGWRWAVRPWVARWKRRREPSRFTILQAEKP
jgi:SAM-dependent methyltransferase